MSLRAVSLAGIGLGAIAYPEAGAILRHYIYGGGMELELSSEYFRRSPYLRARIAELGPGSHGPIWFRQSDDWRLSLALNPYYIDIEEERIRVFHPHIEFAAIRGAETYTIVPIGKLRIRFYDNLVSALDPTPFAAYAEWEPGE